MKRFTAIILLCALLPCLLPAVAWPQSQSLDSTPAKRPDPAQARALLRDYEQDIAAIEASGGAYAAGLSEALLGLGLALQSQGQHQEAVRQFKRGIHLTRVNDGLYSTRQIPLLNAEINSHRASRNYAAVDQRQAYLYRVQMKSASEGASLAGAYMQQAGWQRDAYHLGLGQNDFTRLMNMWDLYRLALEEGVQHEGSNSLTLMPALNGMLQTLYLMADYEIPQQSIPTNDDLSARATLNRFTAYRAQAYERGNTVLAYMKSVELENGRGTDAARTQVMLGDWNLWNGKRDTAWQAYDEAATELASLAVAEQGEESPLAQPAALPDVAGVSKLPPATAGSEGDILLEFGVTANGKVVDLERLDDNGEFDGKANRLMRQLRRTRFRPRFEAGEPVATDKIVRAFDLQ